MKWWHDLTPMGKAAFVLTEAVLLSIAALALAGVIR